MATRYRHDPLALDKQQIRLLEVDFTAGPAIHAALKIFDLDDNLPPYQALSYTWGPENPKKSILINNNEPFSVRQNLYDFLEVLVRKTTIQSQYIWIDQMCIDQTSNQERNHQVSFISNIFSRAYNVLIWLGNHDEDDRFACVLRKLEHLRGSQHESMRRFSDENDRDVMGRFIDLPYWKRLWVIQEILLAKARIIVYGSDILDQDLVEDFFVLSMLERLYDAKRPSNILEFFMNIGIESLFIDDHFERKLVPLDRRHIATLISIETLCSDPRDHVYGLQSLFPPAVRIQVDYDKSIDQVFLEASAQHIASDFSTGGEWQLEQLALRMGLMQDRKAINKHIEPYTAWLRGFERESLMFMPEVARWTELGRQAKQELHKMMALCWKHRALAPTWLSTSQQDKAIKSVAIVWANRVRTESL